MVPTTVPIGEWLITKEINYLIVKFRRITALIVELILENSRASDVIESSLDHALLMKYFNIDEGQRVLPGPVSIMALTYQVVVSVMD